MATYTDRNDTSRALVQHATSGDLYVVEIASIWRETPGEELHECIGGEIVTAAGPVYYGDLGSDGGPLEPSRDLFDRIDDWQNLTDEDAAWLQELDASGQLVYPIGMRSRS